MASFYYLFCSGLTNKTTISFTSSNSSFIECVRKQLSSKSSFAPSSTLNSECTAPPYEQCSFTQNNHPSSSDSSFTSCIFIGLSSDDNGGAICFTSSGALCVLFCSFSQCNTSIGHRNEFGGGAIFTNSSSLLTITSSMFMSCKSLNSFGGAVLGTSDCASTVVSDCYFLGCSAEWDGGGLCTHVGPRSDVLSSNFILCTVSSEGGGIYHNSLNPSSDIFLSNSLFQENHAGSAIDRGGGGFGQYRTVTYNVQCSFCFFTRNTDSAQIAHDFMTYISPMEEDSIVHCFTTTKEDAIYNAGSQITPDWLPLTTVSLSLSEPYIHTHKFTYTNHSNNRDTINDYHPYSNFIRDRIIS